jgi:hypothetical protein
MTKRRVAEQSLYSYSKTPGFIRGSKRFPGRFCL